MIARLHLDTDKRNCYIQFMNANRGNANGYSMVNDHANKFYC